MKEFKQIRIFSTQNSGFIALMTVVLVGAVALIAAISASTIGLGELELSVSQTDGYEVRSVAEGCMEETLSQVRQNNGYGVGVGSTTQSLLGGVCTWSVIDEGGGIRTIFALASSSENYAFIQITATVSTGTLSIISRVEY